MPEKSIRGPSHAASCWVLFKLWLGLVSLFTLGRLAYLWNYRSLLGSDEVKLTEVAYVFVSALRFDSHVSSFLLLPVFLAVIMNWFWPQWLDTKSTRFLAKIYSVFIFLLSLTLVISDHFYFIYFNDHFNIFFWEFWLDENNAQLVVDGIGDVINLSRLALLAVAVAITGYIVVRFLCSSFGLPRWFSELRVFAQKRYFVPLVLFVFLVLFRATFDHRPLTLQDRRVTISKNTLLNLLHTNPLIPLYRSYIDQGRYRGEKFANLDRPKLRKIFENASYFQTGSQIVEQDGNFFFQQKILPSWSKFLKRQPRHVVVIFMESYAGWVARHSDRDFAREMAKTQIELEQKGLSFKNHFSAGKGTLKSISAAMYSLSIGRSPPRPIAYLKEASKELSSKLADRMEENGFESIFLYGGIMAWHRLYSVIPNAGYEHFFAENSFPELGRHPPRPV